MDFQVPQIQAPTQEPSLSQNSNNSQESESDYTPSLGNEFLSKIPDHDRPIVEKYVKDWDAGVTSRFQSIHKQYEPYKELGDIESVKQAMVMNQALMSDPISFYNHLQATINELREEGYLDMEIEEGLGVDLDEEGQLEGGGQQQRSYSSNDSDPYAKIADLEAKIEMLTGKFSENEQAANDAKEMQQLDEMMKTLHTEHGAFDDDYFLVQLANGLTPEQAIEKWNSLVEGAVNSRPRKSPPLLMSGAGNVPGNQVDPSKLSAQDRIKFITGSLESARG